MRFPRCGSTALWLLCVTVCACGDADDEPSAVSDVPGIDASVGAADAATSTGTPTQTTPDSGSEPGDTDASIADGATVDASASADAGRSTDTGVADAGSDAAELDPAELDWDGDGDPVPTDCDDMDPNRSSLRAEIGGNGIDDDCDSSTADDDTDGDGVLRAVDCDDRNPDVGARIEFYWDQDGDTFTDGGGSLCAASLPAGAVETSSGEDCDPYNPFHWSDCATCVDEDRDDFGTGCDSGEDCDDSRAHVNPLAPEIPDNGMDEDCVDGDLRAQDGSGIYVNGTAGNDANAGTPSAPVQTIAKGIELAAPTGAHVFVAEGTYDETITLDGTTNLAAGVHGGYEALGWTRDIAANVTVVDAADRAVDISDATATLSGLVLHGGTSGAVAISSSRVTIESCIMDTVTGSAAVGAGTSGEVTGHLLVVRNCTVTGGDRAANDVAGLGSRVATVIENTIVHSGSSPDGVVGVNISTREPVRLVGNTVITADGANNSYGVLVRSDELWMQDNTVIPGTSNRRSVGVFLSEATGTLVGGTSTGGAGASNYSEGLLVTNASDVTVRDAVFQGGMNAGASLGAVVGGSTVVVARSRLEGGSGTTGSAGMWCEAGGEFTAVNSILLGGESALSAAAHVDGCDLTLVNDTLQVSSTQAGRGVELVGTGTSVLVNTIVDMLATPGTALWTDGMAAVTLRNDDLYGSASSCAVESTGNAACNTAAVDIDDCASWAGCASSSGNIVADPSFADTDYNLDASSPCQGTGVDPTPWDTEGLYSPDYDGEPRPQSGHDMGAQEHPGP